MRICIFSDIHGNMEAMKGMFAATADADLYLFAGDIFGYFYEQKQIIDCLRHKRNVLAIRGNHESNYLCCQQEKQTLIENYGSSYNAVLTKEQCAYIEELPDFLEVELAGKRFGIFHGGYEDYLNQRIYPDSDISAELICAKYDYVILGHTHYRFLRRVQETVVINPGSLGQPRDGKGFSYCILHTDTGYCEFKTVKIDLQGLLAEVRQRDFDRKVCKYLHDKYGGIA